MLMAPPSATKFLGPARQHLRARVRAALAGIHAPGSTYFVSPTGTLVGRGRRGARVHVSVGRLAGTGAMAGIRARAGKVDRRVGLLFGIFVLLLVVALGRALYLGTVKASALRAGRVHPADRRPAGAGAARG